MVLGHPRTLGICLRWDPWGIRFLISKVSLHQHGCHECVTTEAWHSALLEDKVTHRPYVRVVGIWLVPDLESRIQGLRLQSLGSKVSGSWIWVDGLGIGVGVEGLESGLLGFRVQGMGSRVQGYGIRAGGEGCGIEGLGV